MNVVVEPLPNCLATMRVEVEPEKVNQTLDKLVTEYGKQARIPGFRQGKAPRAVVERKFKKQIQEELESWVLRDAAREAIAQEKLRVLQISNVEDIQFGDGKGMTFTATLVTHPEFELPEYKGLPIEAPSAEVTDAEIDESIENLRDQAADFRSVPDRAAEMGDYIVVNYEGTIDGKPVHEVFPKAGKPLTANEDFWIKMTDEAFFPGYCANLVGAKPGETREFDVEVPSDFPVEGMPGAKIHYKVTLNGVKEKVLPELDDDFASSIVKGKTLAELREMAREELGKQKLADVQANKRTQVMKHLLAKVECELPVNMVRYETQRILNDIVRENQSRGVTDEVLKSSEQQLVGVASSNAREKIKGTFILHRIAEKEGITIRREELFGRIAAMAERYEMPFEKMLKALEKKNAIDQIGDEILSGKVLDFLVANASVSDAPVAAEASK